MGVAVWRYGRCFGAERTSFLPPLKLTLQEAVTLFLSTRLMARYQDHRDPHVISAFNKLASILPGLVAQQVHASAASVSERPRDDHRIRIFDLLATAWAEGRKVRIWYPSSPAVRARESHWHSSQREEVNADGSVDLTFEVGGILEITPWILSWGGAVEVVAPVELRERIAQAARDQAAHYPEG